MRTPPGPLRRFCDRARARRDGRRDGLLGIPTREEVVHPPALLQIARRERRRQTVDAEPEVSPAPTERGVGLSPRVYAVAIVAILIAEFPLNAIAFRLFGEAEVLTWIMTASLAVTLVLCAHGLGTFLRQQHPSIAERRWIIVLVALPVLAIVGIALIRARYLSLEASTTGLDVMGPVVGSLVFLVINLLVYTGATMLSYLAHSPRSARPKRTPSATEDARRELAGAEQRLREATGRVRLSEQQLTHTDVATEEAQRVSRARAAEIVAYHRGLMSVYCAANLRARGGPDIPQILRELPAIEVPPTLRERDDDGSRGNGHATDASVTALRAEAQRGAR
jgi:hypothetical protein